MTPWILVTVVRPLLVDLFLWFVLVRPLRLHASLRLPLALLLLLDVLQPVVLQSCGGSWLMPDLPGPLLASLHLLRALACLYFFELVPLRLLPLAARALRRLFRRPASRPAPDSFSRPRRLALVLLLLNFALLSASFLTALLPPRVVAQPLSIPDLPADLDGYAILHLSDLHADPIAGAWRTRAIVDRANAAAPDLVCITGDFADGAPSRFAPALAPLAGLRAPDGVFACTGNHEFYPPAHFPDWLPVYRSLGVTFLDGPPAAVARGNARLLLSGMHDEHSGATLLSRLEAAGFSLAPPDPDECRVFLKHRPVDLAPLASARVHLVLSGHTHAGQLPLLDRLVTAFNQGHLSGLYRLPPATLLHVSPGASQWNGLPFRLFHPPQITLLVLRRGLPPATIPP
jgi:hypothetical protein